MGRIYGSNKVIGTIGGVRHYLLPGCDFIVVAESGGATKEQIQNNAAFERTRENNAEWQAVTKMAKEVKRMFGQCAAPVVDRFLIGSLNKAMLKTLRQNEVDKRGCRSLYLSAHKEMLDSIKYYYYKPFTDIMKCRFEVDTGPDRKSVAVRLLNLFPGDHIKPPPLATHFQFFLSIGVVGNVVYRPENKDFVTVYNKVRMTHCLKEFESEWIPINGQAMGDLNLSVTLPEDFMLEDDMTVLRVFGIVFGKMTSEVEPLKRDRGSVEFLGAV